MTEIETRLCKVTLPTKTKSYSPVSHREMIITVRDLLENTTDVVLQEKLISGKIDNGGKLTLLKYPFMFSSKEAGGYCAREGVLMAQNSYNKKAKLEIKLAIKYEDKLLPINQIHYKRKHTGSIVKEMQEFKEQFSIGLEDVFKDSIDKITLLKFIKIPVKDVFQHIGELYLDNTLTITQIASIKRAFLNDFKKEKLICLFDTYALISNEIVNTSHSKVQMKAISDSYYNILSKFNIQN
jgi:hypothetical protein